MSKIQGLNLRLEQAGDFRVVEELTREAFWNHYVPGCDEHYLLHIMRSAGSFIKDLDFVAEVDGKIVGNIVYTRAKVIDDEGGFHEAITFGPLSVLPEYQGRGIGTALVELTISRARELGHKVILIYGDPGYYSRFGFVPAESFRIRTSENMYAPALQVLEMVEGTLSYVKGRFVEDTIFELDECEAQKFDEDFPKKEKLDNLPSQQRFRHLLSLVRPADLA